MNTPHVLFKEIFKPAMIMRMFFYMLAKVFCISFFKDGAKDNFIYLIKNRKRKGIVKVNYKK